MSGDRLAQIERYAKQPDIVGVLPQTHRMLPVADVLALVAIAKLARDAADNARVVLPSVGSNQTTVMALLEEWQDAAQSVSALDAALARLDSGAAEEGT